jgi:predicted O-linked N-acetylglucosamine transferase (SPINDLY family)
MTDIKIEISKLLTEKKFQKIINLINANINYKRDSWVYNILGCCYLQIQNTQEAIQNFELSIFQDKNNANPYFNLALLYSANNEKNLSNNFFIQAIELDSNNAEYKLAYANFLQKLNNDIALRYYNDAIKISPEKVEIYLALSQYYINKNKYNDALNICKQYFQKYSKHPQLLNNYCVALLKSGKFKEAINNLHSALQFNSKMEELHLNLGICYFSLEQYEESLNCFSRVLQLNKNNEKNLIFYALSLSKLNQPIQSIKYLRAAYKIKKNPVIYFHLGNVFYKFRRTNFALQLFKKSVELDSNHVLSFNNYLFTLRFKECLTEDYYLQAAKKFNTKIQFSKSSNLNSNLLINKKLKIGFVSGDFNQHPVGRFLLGILDYLKDNFVLHGYYNNTKEDFITEELKKKFNSWTNIYGVSDNDVVESIKSHNVNILFDLSGHTSNNRYLVFKLRPAPIQISWIGFLASTGLKEMDYLIADKYTVEDKHLKNFSEKVIRLPNIWNTHLYEENIFKNKTSPCILNKYLTLGCFNNPNKINCETIELYSEILKSNKNIKIIFKFSNIENIFIKNSIMKHFKKNKAPIENILFEKGTSRNSLLESYNKIDISLDPINYNGGASSFESVIMGVPVMSLIGNTFLSRCGYSINMNLNLPKMIAKNKIEFIKNINYYYNNMIELDIIRKLLIEKGKFSNLFNHEKLAKNLTKELYYLYKRQ